MVIFNSTLYRIGCNLQE